MGRSYSTKNRINDWGGLTDVCAAHLGTQGAGCSRAPTSVSGPLWELALFHVDDLVFSFFIRAIKSFLLPGHSYSDKPICVHILMGFIG